MALDLIASVLVGLLAIVSMVLLVRGILGMIAREDRDAHYHW